MRAKAAGAGGGRLSSLGLSTLFAARVEVSKSPGDLVRVREPLRGGAGEHRRQVLPQEGISDVVGPLGGHRAADVVDYELIQNYAEGEDVRL